MKKLLSYIFINMANLLVIPAWFLVFLIYVIRKNFAKKNANPKLVWGTDPILNNKYWSKALQEVGYPSTTLMSSYYPSINTKSDYDLYFDDFLTHSNKIFGLNFIVNYLRPYVIFLWCIWNYDIFHISANGFILKYTALNYFEAYLLKFAKKKVIVLPYGSDFYRYSKVNDLSLRHALLKSYPLSAIQENLITKKFNYWVKFADIFLPGLQTDATGRWDSLSFSFVTIDEKDWSAKSSFSNNDGINGSVKILHTPNHRGFKGTEFILNAIEELKAEGLRIDIILVEKKSNNEVKHLMQVEADILVEQLVATGYALSAIEGMASGLPVLSNLHSEYYTRVFRRYSYLNECPILSSTPETIKGNIRILVRNPILRKALGKAGRSYVEKYHSFKTTQYLFHKIYEKIWSNKQVDLMDIYHPLSPDSYNKKYAQIYHPLIENKLPENWQQNIADYV